MPLNQRAQCLHAYWQGAGLIHLLLEEYIVWCFNKLFWEISLELFNSEYKSEFMPTFLSSQNKEAKENIWNKGDSFSS